MDLALTNLQILVNLFRYGYIPKNNVEKIIGDTKRKISTKK